jgi:tRNA nucleotidyltransferase (CCA-adding enzyme)
MCVCDAAAEIASREQLSPENRMILMFAALCHDLGKPATTVRNEQGRWSSPAHDKAGEEPTISFLKSINSPNWLIENVVPLVVEHMAHVHCEPTHRIVRRLANRLHPSNLKMWSAVCEADHSGRPPKPAANPVIEWMELAKEVKVDDGKPKPILMGRHLLELGEKPGKEMGEKLKKAFQAQLDGLFSTPEEGIAWLATN